MKVGRAPRAPALGLWAALLLAAGPAAHAHPHAWIDLKTAVVLDPHGRVVGLEQEWLFDPLYTALLTEDHGTTPAALRANGEGVLERLKDHAYFTQIRVDGEVRPSATVREFTAELRSGRYWLRFVLPLDAALDPTAHSFSYAVFDPTYYIEMRHHEDQVIGFVGAGSRHCEARIRPPTPTAEAMLRARSFAVDATPDDSLGALFAERVEVGCR